MRIMLISQHLKQDVSRHIHNTCVKTGAAYPNPNAESHECEKEKISCSSTHPRKGWLPLRPPEKDLMLLPFPGRENYYKKKGRFTGYLGRTPRWESLMNEINSLNVCRRKCKREGQTET